jgi:hypothetical protein
MIAAKGWFRVTLLGVLDRANIDDAGAMRPKFRRLDDSRARTHPLKDESGIALIMALAVMLVLTVLLTSVIFFTSSNARDAQRTNAGQKAYALAEAGINNALAVLHSNYPGSVAYPGDSTLLPARTSTYSTGSVTWSGTLDAAAAGASWTDQWNITATGSVVNPTGPGTSPVRRTVKTVVPVVVPASENVNGDSPLNWIYSSCDLAFENSVTIGSPVFAGRDLILGGAGTNLGCAAGLGSGNGGGASVLGTAHTVVVGGVDPAGGNLYMTNSQNQIGKLSGSDVNLHAMYIVPGSTPAGMCSTQANSTLHPCVWTGADKLFTDNHAAALPAYQLDDSGNPILDDNGNPVPFITKPTFTCCSPEAGTISPAPSVGDVGYPTSDVGYWFRNADLGPNSPCQNAGNNFLTAPLNYTFDIPTASGSPANTVDNSATPTNPLNLTPSTSYDCKSFRNGAIRGELKWDEASHVLTVQGNIFIDGSVTAAPSGSITTPSTSKYIDPNSNGTLQQWTANGASLIDDGVRSPTTPTTGVDSIKAGVGAGQKEDIKFGDGLVFTTGATYTLWMYGSTGGGGTTINYAISGDDGVTFGAAADTGLKNSASWKSVTITPTTQAQLDGMAVEFTSGKKNDEIDAVYVQQTLPASTSMAMATYTGKGAIIMSGTFGMSNSSLCVAVKGSACDTTAVWDPNVAVLVIEADGDGGGGGAQSQGNLVGSGVGIDLKSSNFQGGLVANKVVNIETTSGMQGPMVSVYKSVLAGQSGTLTFPPIRFAPSGGGGITGPLPLPQLLAPQQFGGG